MHPPVRILIEILWGTAGVVWFVGSLTAKRTARAQSSSSRLLHISIGALAFIVGFTKPFAFAPLTQPFVPDSPAVAYTGVLLTLAGVGLAIWARVFLGGNWSGTVTVKEHHSLVKNGPYAIVRHPIYSGLLLALLGTAVAFRELRILIAAGLALVMYAMKVNMEEKFMIEEFGAEYQEYRRRVKALIPFVY